MEFVSSLVRPIWAICLLYALASVVLPQSSSPRKIAYSRGGAIYLINEDGTGQTGLTAGGYNETRPSWSPDGSAIAFQSNRYGGRANILRMNADGTGLVPLTDWTSPDISQDPSWSPDGLKIAFVSDQGGARRNEIWVMNADGTNLKRLTTNIQFGSDSGGPYYSQDFAPAWSPDATKIVFTSNRDDIANPEIYVMSSDGSNQTRLTNNSAEDSDPVWSPDGGQIAFFSRGGGRIGIYAIDTNGANDHRISVDGFQPDWSPDGQKLAVTDFDPQASYAFAVYLINSDGSNRTKLTNNGSVDSSTPAWQRTGGPAPPPPPGSPVYSASGEIVDSSLATPFAPGPGVPGVTVILTGTVSASTTTDANGKFLFSNLPQNGTFTVTPATTNWSLFPAARTFGTSLPLIGFVGSDINLYFDAAPIFLEFITQTFSGFEDSAAVVTVVRVGSILGTSTIDYATSDGTAKVGVRYLATSGTLKFNPFETMKSFSVPLIYNGLPEPPQTINVSLSNPTGSTSRGKTTAAITVSDPPPGLITEGNTSRAAAFNSPIWLRDPFPLTGNNYFSSDSNTHIALFARYVDLLPSEGATAVSVQAIDSQQQSYQLPVESVTKVPDFVWLTQINVTLPLTLPAGDLQVFVTLRGVGSNFAGLRIK